MSSAGDWERNADPQQARNRQNPRSRRRGAVEPMSRRKSIVKLDADAAADLERVARELIEFSRAERTKAGRGDAHGSRHEPLHHRVTREGGVPAGRDERLRLRRGRQGRRAARGARTDPEFMGASEHQTAGARGGDCEHARKMRCCQEFPFIPSALFPPKAQGRRGFGPPRPRRAPSQSRRWRGGSRRPARSRWSGRGARTDRRWRNQERRTILPITDLAQSGPSVQAS